MALKKENIDQAPKIACPICKNTYFSQVLELHKVSKIVAGTSTDIVAPTQNVLFKCTRCNSIISLDNAINSIAEESKEKDSTSPEDPLKKSRIIT